MIAEALRSTTSRIHDRTHRGIDRWVPETVQRFVNWVRSDEFITISSSLAFYAMISLPPMVLVALWIAGVVVPDASLQGLGGGVNASTPEQIPIGNVLRSLIDIATEVGFLAMLAALWPATTYGSALARAFNRITPDEERKIQGYKGRLFSLVIVALLPLAIFGGMALLYVGPRLLPEAGPWMTAAFASGAYGVVVAVVATLFALFRMVDTTVSDIALGALAAATLMGLATALYLLYLETFADYRSNYGAASLATTVLLGFWLMLNNAMLIVGYRVMVKKATRRGQERGRDVSEEDVAEPSRS